MRRRCTYHLLLLWLFVATAPGCGKLKARIDPEKWRITLKQDDKKPYGAYLGYESLKRYFPGATTTILPPQYRFTSIDEKMRRGKQPNVLVLAGLRFYISEEELSALEAFVRDGNEVVIFSNRLDGNLESRLGIEKLGGMEEAYITDSAKLTVNARLLRLAGNDSLYGYRGRALNGFFRPLESEEEGQSVDSTTDLNANDTSITPEVENTIDTLIDSLQQAYADDNIIWRIDTLGYADSEANFLRIGIGEGHITLHAAPLVVSNYFLLQQDNINYLNAVWASLPSRPGQIYWASYYKRRGESAKVWVLWRHRATKWGLSLAIFVLSVYILFQAKRRQRVIPVLPPLRNDSVSFVETVGRLYYNKGNHANLAHKMVQQFLEWVRVTYYLNTNIINEDFIMQLMQKTGQPEEKARSLVLMIHEIKADSATPDDPYLYRLHHAIEDFYSNK
ncbi:MAG: hypothetical protein H7257_14470 [Taibaiella sp.]|nr:hypothetical protein [Taibaiella sp.]